MISLLDIECGNFLNKCCNYYMNPRLITTGCVMRIKIYFVSIIIVLIFSQINLNAEKEFMMGGGFGFSKTLNESYNNTLYSEIAANVFYNKPLPEIVFSYSSWFTIPEVNTVFGKIKHINRLDIFGIGLNYKFLKYSYNISNIESVKPFIGIGSGINRIIETHKVLDCNETLSSTTNYYVKPVVGVYYVSDEGGAFSIEVRYDYYLKNFKKYNYTHSSMTGINPKGKQSKPLYLTIFIGFSLWDNIRDN